MSGQRGQTAMLGWMAQCWVLGCLDAGQVFEIEVGGKTRTVEVCSGHLDQYEPARAGRAAYIPGFVIPDDPDSYFAEHAELAQRNQTGATR